MRGVFFRHRVVVTPAAPLGPAGLTCADWLGVGIAAFTEFTRFSNVLVLNVVGQLLAAVVERGGGNLTPVRGWRSHSYGFPCQAVALACVLLKRRPQIISEGQRPGSGLGVSCAWGTDNG